MAVQLKPCSLENMILYEKSHAYGEKIKKFGLTSVSSCPGYSQTFKNLWVCSHYSFFVFEISIPLFHKQ